ncbi:hypothetical protein EWE75_24460 [Sphingomonas populi]|uniref:Uncharacterized protein n=1 Tax=Sphingomonas populi TaxID=2484750 RepID=A0A4Q6XFG6_9SPHN|nr:hypothetical protein [Sphingomonas populi]RZF58610.1 hypothetical protein EWE75_24460 [Sphingomonas populi]
MRVISTPNPRQFYAIHYLNWKPGDGVITIGCEAESWTVNDADLSAADLFVADFRDSQLSGRLEILGRAFSTPGISAEVLPIFYAQTIAIKKEQHRRAVEAFKAQHDLTDEEFASDHWQTLFAIQYPQITSYGDIRDHFQQAPS